MVVASTIALPIQQIAFALPLQVKGFGEKIYWTDGVAIVLVLLGFWMYSRATPQVSVQRAALPEALINHGGEGLAGLASNLRSEPDGEPTGPSIGSPIPPGEC